MSRGVERCREVSRIVERCRGVNLLEAAAQNELKLSQDFTLSSSRPSQSIYDIPEGEAELILRLPAEMH